MNLSDVSGDGRPWTVELDVRDLGGHLDFWQGRLRMMLPGENARVLFRRKIKTFLSLTFRENRTLRGHVEVCTRLATENAQKQAAQETKLSF